MVQLLHTIIFQNGYEYGTLNCFQLFLQSWQAVTNGQVACYCSLSQVRIFCFSFGSKDALERFIVIMFSNFNSIYEVVILVRYKFKFNKEFITFLKSVI